MSITIGDAILYLRANSDQLDAGLKKAHTDTESMFGKLGKVIGGGLAIGAAAGVAGLAGLAVGLTDCTKAAMEAQDIEAQLDAVLKSTGIAADAQAKQLADAAGKMVWVADATASAGGKQKDTAGQIEKLNDSLERQKARLADQEAAWAKAKTHTESARVALEQSREAISETTAKLAALSTETGAATGKWVPLTQVLGLTAPAARMTKDELVNLANSLSGVTKFEDDAIISGESMLLTFTGIGKDVFPAATEAMLDMSQALGQDMKASAIQLGKALNDPIAGATALRKVGVSLTDAQEAQIKAFMKSGDIMSAQKLILKELAVEFGGSARAAGQTMAGQMVILQNKIGNVKEAIGAALLPTLTKLATMLNDVFSKPEVQAAIENIAKGIGKIIEAAAELITGIFGGAEDPVGDFTNVIFRLGEMLGLTGEQMRPMFAQIRAVEDLLTGRIIPAIKAFIGDVVEIFNTFKDAVTGVLGSPEMKALGKAYEELFKTIFGSVSQLGGTGPSLQTWATVIKNAINGAALVFTKYLIPAFTEVVKIYNSVLKPVLEFIVTEMKKIAAWVKENWPLIQKTITTVMKAIQTVIETVLKLVKGFWDTYGKQIMVIVENNFKSIKIIIDTVLKVILGIIKTVMKIITGDWKGAWESIKQIAKDLWDGIKQLVANALDTLNKTIIQPLMNAIATWLSNKWAEIKKKVDDTWEAIKLAISTAWENIRTNIQNALTAIATWLSNKWEEIRRTIQTTWETITTNIRTAWENIRRAIEDALNRIAAWLVTKWEEIRRAIQTAWETITTNIRTAWENIRTNIENALNNIATWLSNKWEEIRRSIQTAWETITTNIRTAWENIRTAIETALNNIATWLSNKWEEIRRSIQTAWDTVVTNITTAWDNIRTAIQERLNDIQAWLSTKWEEIRLSIQTAWETAVTNITNAWNDIRTAIQERLNDIQTWLSTKWEEIKQKITDTWDNVITGVTEKWEAIKEEIKKFVTGENGITSIFTKLHDAAVDIWNGLTGENGVVGRIWNGILDTIKSGVNGIIGVLNSLIGIYNAVIGVIGGSPIPTFDELSGGRGASSPTALGGLTSRAGLLQSAQPASPSVTIYGGLSLYGVQDAAGLLSQLAALQSS